MTSTSARIQLAGREPCEYVVRLINYDLIGRDAVAEARIWYHPAVPSKTDTIHILLFSVPAVALILLIIVLKVCVRLICRSRKQKITSHEKSSIAVL
ncbi:hypothetical protein Tcan_11401 [Toxocara canis]|uniref:Uncharacterized protein n=1 Tax=Toxocara canis TaxID=6265 RepID=A0A0B2VME1_TOXCA|nr:hypothetical protein Tcan_11401 [Toxocara canis]